MCVGPKQLICLNFICIVRKLPVILDTHSVLIQYLYSNLNLLNKYKYFESMFYYPYCKRLDVASVATFNTQKVATLGRLK